uniref:Uncharacterized protein n=1 Tax=Arundo donax TaxID=35708 RepID=A0A0A9DAG6_ARUDO
MPQFHAESQEPTRMAHNNRSSGRGAAHLPATTRTLHADGKPSAPPQTSGPSAPPLTLLVSRAFRDLQPVRSSPFLPRKPGSVKPAQKETPPASIHSSSGHRHLGSSLYQQRPASRTLMSHGRSRSPDIECHRGRCLGVVARDGSSGTEPLHRPSCVPLRHPRSTPAAIARTPRCSAGLHRNTKVQCML